MATATGRIVLGGLRGGTGKTTIALGIIAAWKRRGRTIVPFKKGPDYIDAGWLAAAAGSPCFNLDLFMMGRDSIVDSYVRRSAGADAAVIEGNRGLYDGSTPDGTYSTAELAKLLKCPVVLIVDGTKATATLAAMVLGCQTFDPTVEIRGVIVNQVFGKRHEDVARRAIEGRCGLPVLGVIPRLMADRFPERHMGLTPSPEHPEVSKAIEGVADVAEEYLDLDALWKIALDVPILDEPVREPDGPAVRSAYPPRIGVIRDRAFQFYYPENLEALERGGAVLVDINAFEDPALPDLDALYIGGGFPETQAERLSANVSFRRSVRDACERGLPVYAECGGLMYLAEELVVGERTFPMVGALPAAFQMEKRPQAHGYSTIRVTGKNPYYVPGLVANGHEFHYSRLVRLDRKRTSLAFQMERGEGLINGRDGLCYRNVLATYTHVHALGTGAWAEGILRRAAAFRKSERSLSSGKRAIGTSTGKSRQVWIARWAMTEDPAPLIQAVHDGLKDQKTVYRSTGRGGPASRGDLIFLDPPSHVLESRQVLIPSDPLPPSLVPVKSGRACMLWDASYFWGSMAIGVFDELRFPIEIVSATEVAEDALSGADLLFVPGGWAHDKSSALGERGRDAIREFVRRGGSYLGLCGGAGLALDVRDGLAIVPVARKETRDRNPNFSGRIRVRPLRRDHPLWLGLSDDPAFHAWWPSQFRISDPDSVRVLAEYDVPEEDFFAADLKAGDISDWSRWERRYGINLDPARLRGEPVVLEGCYGKGRVILSYVHFETPGNPMGYRGLFNLWQYLLPDRPSAPRSVRQASALSRPNLSASAIETLETLSREMSDLIDLGQRMFLWNWRMPWMLNWRRGSRGFEFLTVYTLLRQIAALSSSIGTGTERVSARSLDGDVKSLEMIVRAFVSRSRRLLLEERYAAVPGRRESRLVRTLREELFGNSHLYGGLFRQLLTSADSVLFPLIRPDRPR